MLSKLRGQDARATNYNRLKLDPRPLPLTFGTFTRTPCIPPGKLKIGRPDEPGLRAGLPSESPEWG